MPNLLQKASIVLTPTAYDDGKVLCAKPSEPPYGDFDFSRNSAATRVNAQGLVENVQILSGNLVQNGDFSELGSEEVSNGSFSQEGSELVTNGSFDTDSDWSKGTGWSIANGKASCDGTQTGWSILQQNNILPPDGSIVKIVATVSNYSSGNLYLKAGYAETGFQISSDGTFTTYRVVNGSSQFRIQADLNFIGSIDNVSVKEVGQDWTFGTGWSVGEDKAIFDGGSDSNLVSASNVLNGKSYKYSFTISDMTNGALSFRLGASSTNDLRVTTDGTYTGYALSDGTGIRFRAESGFNGSVTNISVKEVGQDWTLGTSWSIGDDKAISDATQGYIVQTNVGGAGLTATYKVQWTQNITAGTRLRFFARNYNDGGTITTLSITRDDGVIVSGGNCVGSGTFTAYVSSTNGYSFKLLAEAGVEADITNITTIQITDDTNLPRINYEGFSYQDALGSELIDYSTLTSGSSSWSLVDGLWVFDDTANGYLVTPNVSVVVGDTYKVVVDVTIASGNANFRYQSGNGQTRLFDYTDFVDGVNTLTTTVVGVDGIVTRLFAPTSLNDNSFTLNSISIKKINGQEVVPDSGCGSWLFEPQRTNFITYSENFSNSYWTKTNTTVTSGFVSPNGTNNAYKVLPTASGTSYGDVSISKIISAQPTSVKTNSFFVKSNGQRWVYLFPSDGGTPTFFDLQDGVVGTINAGAEAKIETYSNDWYRIYLTQGVVSYNYISIGFCDGDNNPTYTQSSNSIFLYGGQAEVGSYATSYIPTSGTSVTRNQDVCTNGGSLASINSSDGTLYAEIEFKQTALTNGLYAISDGTFNNFLMVRFSPSNKIQVEGTGGVNIIESSVRGSGNYKTAVKYSSSGVELWVDGTKIIETSTQTSISGINEIMVGKSPFGNIVGCKTKCVAVYKEALSDEELTLLTAPSPVAPTFTLDFDEIANQFTFNRASFATRVNEQGLIETVSNIGSELVTNGSFDTDSDWILTSGANISNGKLNIDAPAYDFFARQDPIVEVGKQYKVSFDIDIQSGSGVGLYLYNTGTLKTVTESGSYTFYVTADGTGLRFRALAAPVLGSIDNVSVKEYTEDDIPRIDYSTGTEAFLLEPQSTNTATYSEAKAVYSYSDSTIRENVQIITPYGYESKAVKIDAEAGDNSPIRAASFNLGSYSQNDVITLSGFVKYNGYRYVQFGGYFGDESARFDLQEGVVIANLTNVILSSITAFGNDWYKVVVTYTFQNHIGNGNLYGGWVISPEPDFQFTNAPSGGIYVWGLQAELGTGTSYIPTDGTSVTRVGETCVNATPEINSEEGVLYAEIAALADDSTNRRISLSHNSGNYVRIVVVGSSLRFQVSSNGTQQTSLNYTVSNITDFNKVAVKYKENNFALWINGVEVRTDTSGNTPIGLDTLNFSAVNVTSNNFFGNTKDLQYFNEALSDYQLAQLTTI